MITVKVPATTANLGAGFDCTGMALKLYNTIYVQEAKKGLEIRVLNKTDGYIPKDESNFIYKTMKKVFDLLEYRPKGLKIGLLNDIPMTKGLGSSAACIAGGIAAANALCGNKLSMEEMIFLAAQLEGHPDNSTPAFTGGAVVAVTEKEKVNYIKFPIPEKLMFAVFTPDFILRTAKARSILPDEIPFKNAVFNIGRAALLGASLATGNFDNFTLTTQDKIHQPYRQEFIPNMYDIINMSIKCGAKGSFLSGAGPSIISIIDGDYYHFEEMANEYISKLDNKWTLHLFEGDNNGIQITRK